MDLNVIKNLMESGKLQEAYQAINDYIRQHPEDNQGLQLKKQLMNIINEHNQHQFMSVFKQVQQLAKKDPNLGLQKALELNSKHSTKELRSLIATLQEKIQTVNLKDAKTIAKQIDLYCKENRYEEALKIVEQHKNEPGIANKKSEVLNNYVDFKLTKNQTQLSILAPERVIKFLLELQQLAPQHTQLKQLITEQNERKYKLAIQQKKQAIQKLKREIKVLFHQGKFTKSINACQQLQKLNAKSRLAKRYLNKNTHAIAVENHNKAYALLKISK